MTSASDPLVLIVEDEPAQLEVLTYNLGSQGFRHAHAGDGEEALLMIDELQPGPDHSGLDAAQPFRASKFARRLKSRNDTKHIPIIILTARGEETDRVRGLETGADDYVVKPYSVKELIARVRAMLRRTRPAGVGETLEFGDIRLDPEQHKVMRGGRTIRLGPTEYRLLTTFMEKPGRVWSREQLIDRVWGHDSYVDLRTVDVHVGRLRKALNCNNAADPIRTVRGEGYSLDLEY